VSGETLDALSGRRTGIGTDVVEVGGSVGGCVGTGGGNVAVDMRELSEISGSHGCEYGSLLESRSLHLHERIGS
jgi:hypothetical protein